jgi:predicted nuclease of predicted toxin-antitoxin system
MQFKVDENLPVEVVKLLEDNGHDAFTVLGQNLGGVKDSRIAQVCKK